MQRRSGVAWLSEELPSHPTAQIRYYQPQIDLSNAVAGECQPRPMYAVRVPSKSVTCSDCQRRYEIQQHWWWARANTLAFAYLIDMLHYKFYFFDLLRPENFYTEPLRYKSR